MTSDGICEVGNIKIADALAEGRAIERISREALEAYCAEHPLATAAEDDTGYFNDVLKTVLLEQYTKMTVPRSKISDRIIKNCEVNVEIEGLKHMFQIESSVTTDELRSFLTEVRLVRSQRQGAEGTACQIVATTYLLDDGNGGVGLTEKWSLEIDPADKLPESMLDALIGQPFTKLIDAPLTRHPAMKDLVISKIENQGPFGQNPPIYMLTGRVKREL